MVSVIVPIYNVEKYVKKCLDSLATQTLEDVEFILIDDGSTDNSGKIADQYSSDPRFRIFHTENRGLSAARNYGIDQSHGEYLMFVDGDDWVEAGFCEIPYNAAVENNADLVMFRAFNEKHGKIKSYKPKQNELSRIIEFPEAIKIGGNAAWNKLYKKGLFQDVRYPERRVYEDIATTHKLEHKANRIMSIPNRLYCHVYREESISHTYREANRRDEYISTRERYQDLMAYGIPKEKHIQYMYSAAIGYLASTSPCKDELYLQAKSIVDSIKGIPKSISNNRKIALIAWKANKLLFYKLSKISGRLES